MSGLASIRRIGGEPGRDRARGGAVEAVVDLVLQQVGGLIEQVERDQPVGEAADDLVSPPADRREFLEVEKERERVDRGRAIAPPDRKRSSNGRAVLVQGAGDLGSRIDRVGAPRMT